METISLRLTSDDNMYFYAESRVKVYTELRRYEMTERSTVPQLLFLLIYLLVCSFILKRTSLSLESNGCYDLNIHLTITSFFCMQLRYSETIKKLKSLKFPNKNRRAIISRDNKMLCFICTGCGDFLDFLLLYNRSNQKYMLC